MEYVFNVDVERNDWFGEWDRYETFNAINSLRTNEEDDFLRHTDLVCVIENEDTLGMPMPFGIDVTANTDKLKEKLSWKHEDINMPGFYHIDYYENSSDPDSAILKCGLAQMPRLVACFDENLAYEVKRADSNLKTADESTREKLEREREQASTKIKWCMLLELTNQANSAKAYMEKHKEEKIKR